MSRNVAEFVLAELPPPPARVLEVGCGRGELAKELAASGYDVLAIDPDAPEGTMFRRTTIEEFADRSTFAGVAASRSLHHVHDLDTALDNIASVLERDGVFVLDEFAWDRLDARSAREVGIDLDEWREEHADLHTSDVMLDGVAGRFTQRMLSWEPYLFREERQVMTEARERELIAAGRLSATGFRYVGVR
jgi:SAM-dependent methyltransferase